VTTSNKLRLTAGMAEPLTPHQQKDRSAEKVSVSEAAKKEDRPAGITTQSPFDKGLPAGEKDRPLVDWMGRQYSKQKQDSRPPLGMPPRRTVADSEKPKQGDVRKRAAVLRMRGPMPRCNNARRVTKLAEPNRPCHNSYPRKNKQDASVRCGNAGDTSTRGMTDPRDVVKGSRKRQINILGAEKSRDWQRP